MSDEQYVTLSPVHRLVFSLCMSLERGHRIDNKALKCPVSQGFTEFYGVAVIIRSTEIQSDHQNLLQTLKT